MLGAGQALATGFGWLRTLILARLLTPEDFGLVGMATVILGFLSTISDLGLTAATIQRKDLEDGHRDAAFWLSLCMGMVLFVLCCALSPLVALFYKEPRVTGIIVGAAIPLLLGPLSSTHAMLLRRGLEFGRVAGIEAGRNILAGVVSIVAALLGFGYWSIVAGPIASHLFAIPAYTIADKAWRPSRRATRRHVRELFSFSLYVAGASAINYFSSNVDYLIVGRVLGPAALGTYTLAYEMMTFPLTRIVALFSQVLFPAFATIQDKLDEMREHYVSVSRTVALISFPILGWIAVVAPELIALVYGEKWLHAVAAARILSLAGALKCVGTLVGIIFKSRGKASVELYWNIAWLIGLTSMVLVGVRWGTEGVAAAITALCFPGVLFTEWLACQYIELPLRRLLAVLVLPAVTITVTVAGGFALRGPLITLFLAGPLALAGPPALAARLLLLTAAMAVIYAGALRLLHPPIVGEARTFLSYFRKEKKG